MGKLSVFPEEIAVFKKKTGKRVYNQQKILLEMAVLDIGTKLWFITEKNPQLLIYFEELLNSEVLLLKLLY